MRWPCGLRPYKPANALSHLQPFGYRDAKGRRIPKEKESAGRRDRGALAPFQGWGAWPFPSHTVCHSLQGVTRSHAIAGMRAYQP